MGDDYDPFTGMHVGYATYDRGPGRAAPETFSIVLSGRDLSGNDLSRANLAKANLKGVKLTGANLTGADLLGANLHGARMADGTIHD